MSCHTDTKSPHDRTNWWSICLCVFALTIAVSAHAEDEPLRSRSRDTAGALKLPPRANGQDRDSNSSSSKTTSGRFGIWTTIVSLAAIVGCLLLVGHWLKPYLGAPRGLPVEAFELLGRRVIEQKVAVHLIRCGSRVLVVGVSPEGARTLSEITDPEEVRRLTDACHNQTVTPKFDATPTATVEDASASTKSNSGTSSLRSSPFHSSRETSHV